MRTDLFGFDLPEDRIALAPAHPRDAARMLVVRPGATFTDAGVSDLVNALQPGDAMVFNNTRVIAAALDGIRARGQTQARVNVLLHRRIDSNCWLAFARPAKKLAVGDRLRFDAEIVGGLNANVAAKGDAGEVTLAFDLSGRALDLAIAAAGHMPLPPYISSKRPSNTRDTADYQTIYATHDGAVAAPTAGLHFTDDLFSKLDARGITLHFVTLHVGAGTFLPVKADDTIDHKMHAEWGEVSAVTAHALNETRARGGRILAVGTTSLRLLETATTADGIVQPWSGETAIFITPGYRFRAIDILMTNFHLPCSTLFMLVSAFSGLDTMHAAYAHAIAQHYRFYSFGDASLLFPKHY